MKEQPQEKDENPWELPSDHGEKGKGTLVRIHVLSLALLSLAYFSVQYLVILLKFEIAPSRTAKLSVTRKQFFKIFCETKRGHFFRLQICP